MVGGYNKVRHWNAMAVALRHCPEAKAMAAFGDSRGDARSGCRQVQGYSGSSRAGIKPAVCLWLVQGFSSEPEVGHRALCLVAAIALSGEDRSGGAFAAISECAACSTMRQPRRMDSTYAAGYKPRAGLW